MARDVMILRGYELTLYPPATRGQWRVLVGRPKDDLPHISFFGAGWTRDAVVLKAWYAIDAVLEGLKENAAPAYARAA